MINQIVYKLIFTALHTWTNSEKAMMFEKHMEPLLHKQELSEKEVQDWAEKFKYFPIQHVINKPTYEQ